MATTLAPGANAALPGPQVTITGSAGLDYSAIVLSDGDKVASDEDMVFFNQPTAPGVTWTDSALTVDLTALRPGATKVAVVASPSTDGVTFGALPRPTLTVAAGGEQVVCTAEGLSTETVVVLAEVYQRGGQFKVKAVGQGYDDGLAGLATDFGITVDDAPAAAPAAPRISMEKQPLGKVSLDKKGSAVMPISLDKKTAAATTFTCHLDWDGGSASRRSKGADLDFYALVVLADGSIHTVYYRDLGSLTTPPFVRLAGDSTVPGRETIELTNPAALRYVLFCAYSAVENGAGSMKSYGAKAVIDDGRGSQITVPLFDDSEKYWVAIAKMSFAEGGVKVEQVEDYGRSTTENRPAIYADGRYEMGAGPVEFKSS
ncbi:MAG: Tellurium resistance protein [Frankiales bacterium]|nr:Tellurium resistance protein [Frankiales bacterium]